MFIEEIFARLNATPKVTAGAERIAALTFFLHSLICAHSNEKTFPFYSQKLLVTRKTTLTVFFSYLAIAIRCFWPPKI